MKEAIVHEFDPVIYPFKIWIVINKTPDIIAEKFNDYDGNSLNFEIEYMNKTDAFTAMVQSKDNHKYGAVLFFPNKKSMTFEIVAHESSHAAKHLFEHIGADIREHEPFEYVIGWIAGCCEEAKRWKRPK